MVTYTSLPSNSLIPNHRDSRSGISGYFTQLQTRTDSYDKFSFSLHYQVMELPPSLPPSFVINSPLPEMCLNPY